MTSVQPFLVQDDRLLVTDQVKYAVLKGAANNTVVPYNAISGVASGNATNTSTPTTLTWNIQVPSQEVIIDRRVMIRYRVNFLYEKSTDGANAADFIWNATGQFGAGAIPTVNQSASCDALNPFPVSQMIQTVQATINNTTVALNVQDTLNTLLRFHDSRDLSEYMGLCPYLVDRMGIYNNAGNGSTAFQSPGTAILDEAFIPRSAYPVKLLGANALAQNAGAPGQVNVEFECWEPLLVSPFVWAKPQVNSQGIYGVQNISITLNFGNIARLARQLSQCTGGNARTSARVRGVNINVAELFLNYLTPQPSAVMVPRNIVPYYECPRYYLRTGIDIPAATGANDSIVKAGTVQTRSDNLQLNQIPDRLIIAFEPTAVGATGGNFSTSESVPDFYAVIEGLSINFNNQSGLLSTWSQKDLYHASRDSGSKQSWYEFSGQIQVPTTGQNAMRQGGQAYNPVIPVGGTNLPTTGSVLVLEFGRHIELPDYYAPGSIGNFNLQINANLTHFQPVLTTYRMLVITINSGVFVTEKGSSNPYTSLLRKEDVLNASSMEALGCNEFNRMVGGGFFDTLKSIGSTAWKYGKPLLKAVAPVVQDMLSKSSNPYAQMASKGISMASPLLGDGMGAGMGAGDRLSRHARMSGQGHAF
jgi:hypothetical protein